MFVYKISNILNDKVYIGITSKTIEFRWKTHLNSINNKCNRYLYNSMKKYGIEKFKIEELEECKSIKELYDYERFYIFMYRSFNREYGYNNTMGGEINIPNQETRDKLSKLSKERWKDSNWRKMMIEKLRNADHSNKTGWNKGIKNCYSDETLRKMSENRKGKYTGPDNHNYGKLGFMLGKKFTEDHKKKIAKALIGNTNTKKYGEHFNSKKVRCIETGEEFDSVSQAKLKYKKGNIYNAIRRKRLAAGYHWEYVV